MADHDGSAPDHVHDPVPEVSAPPVSSDSNHEKRLESVTSHVSSKNHRIESALTEYFLRTTFMILKANQVLEKKAMAPAMARRARLTLSSRVHQRKTSQFRIRRQKSPITMALYHPQRCHPAISMRVLRPYHPGNDSLSSGTQPQEGGRQR